MRNRRSARSEKVDQKSFDKICPFLVISAIIAGILVLGLGLLRFYSYNLECQVAEIDRGIYELEIKELELTKSLSMLRSPDRIYRLASSNLGMQSASEVMTVTVASRRPSSEYLSGSLASNPEPSESDGAGFHLFVRRANAGN